MTVTLSAWYLPLVVTLLLWGWAILTPARSAGDYCWDLAPLFRAVAALVGSLVAWLVWALLR